MSLRDWNAEALPALNDIETCTTVFFSALQLKTVYQLCVGEVEYFLENEKAEVGQLIRRERKTVLEAVVKFLLYLQSSCFSRCDVLVRRFQHLI